MKLSRPQFCFLVAATIGFVCGGALPVRAQRHHGKTWEVPQATVSTPYAGENGNVKDLPSVELRSREQLSEQDRVLVADSEPVIADRAHWNGMSMNEGSWRYKQIVCPSLPGHLFLRFTRNSGVGDVTVFSVSIPRNGDRVRLIPILKRSYSLFAPAPINALTISAFNHIRAEEPRGGKANWLEDGLCYATLAGANPIVVSPDARPTPGKPVPALTPVLTVEQKGGEVMRFADVAAQPKPVEWTLTFNRKGKLVKVTHTRAPMRMVRPIPAKTSVTKTRMVPASSSN